MELCDDSLKSVLEIKHQVFDRKLNSPMKPLEYYISCEMFKEILYAIQYLHETYPPIIHRDLKPANILITYNNHHGAFFKICDFGLSTVYRQHSMSLSLGKGTPKYIAPEAYGKYDHRADVYSLGRLAEDIFDLDLEGNE